MRRPRASLKYPLPVRVNAAAVTGAARRSAPDDWRDWLGTLFAAHVSRGFAEHHAEFWTWVWAVRPGERPRPFIAIWPRGGGKSASAELAAVALGARGRHYALYISETQRQADDHVQNIAALLESDATEAAYPALASRLLSKFGATRGWRRNRVRTASGYTVDAVGLDSAARGVKLGAHRPDVMILDDLDSEHDTPATVERKGATLASKLLPAGTPDCAVLAAQNLVHPDSIFARLADGRADYLRDRIVSGPHPALRDLACEQRDGETVIMHGTPTWAGQSLDACRDMVRAMGISAFLAECQHDVAVPAGGMYDHLDWQRCEWGEVPDLVRVVLWCDPAVTATDQSDANGIQADGIDRNGRIYRLWSWEQRATPLATMRFALRRAYELGAEHVGVETDQGGDTWHSVYREAVSELREELAGTPPEFRSARAGSGHGSKTHRSAQMLADYERGRIVHVIGTHGTLEAALRRFPRAKPFDLADAAYWSWHELRHGGVGGESRSRVVSGRSIFGA